MPAQERSLVILEELFTIEIIRGAFSLQGLRGRHSDCAVEDATHGERSFREVRREGVAAEIWWGGLELPNRDFCGILETSNNRIYRRIDLPSSIVSQAQEGQSLGSSFGRTC